jgi:putative membrane protein
MSISLVRAFTAASILAAAPGLAQAQGPGRGAAQLNAVDEAFLRAAAPANAALIAMGKLATDKARIDAVREYGRWMVSARGEAARRLATLIRQLGVQPVTVAVTPEQAAAQLKLRTASGDEFDKVYTAIMVAHHEHDIQDFRDEVRSGRNPAIKTFAMSMLPAMQDQLAAAQDLNRDVGAPNVMADSAQPLEKGVAR